MWIFNLDAGFYEGMLWKKGKENTQFLKRKFVLSEQEFTLTYYNKENVSPVQNWHKPLRNLDQSQHLVLIFSVVCDVK